MRLQGPVLYSMLQTVMPGNISKNSKRLSGVSNCCNKKVYLFWIKILAKGINY